MGTSAKIMGGKSTKNMDIVEKLIHIGRWAEKERPIRSGGDNLLTNIAGVNVLYTELAKLGEELSALVAERDYYKLKAKNGR